MNRLLATAFEPFAGAQSNSSQWVLEDLAAAGVSGWELETLLLPVVYDEAPALLLERARGVQPGAVLMLGMAKASRVVKVEACSRNLDNRALADNAGVLREAQPIFDGGDAQLESPWAPRQWRDALLAAGIPARVSHDAGGFLCNHCYHHALASGNRAIFLHVPAPASDAGGWQRHEATAFARVLARLIPLLAAWRSQPATHLFTSTPTPSISTCTSSPGFRNTCGSR